MFTIVVYPVACYGNAKVIHNSCAESFADINLEDLEKEIQRLYGWSDASIEQFEFLLVGNNEPFKVEKTVLFALKAV